MDSLPTELVERILDHCEFLDLKNLRLTSQAFEYTTTPRIFNHFYMACFDHCLDNLCALATSRLAKHVKRFTLYSDTIPEWSRELWEAHICCRAASSSSESFSKIMKEMNDRQEEFPDISHGMYVKSLPTGSSVHVPGSGHRRVRCAPHASCLWSPFVDVHYPRSNLTPSQLDSGWKTFNRLVKERFRWHQDVHGLRFKEHFAMLPNIFHAEVTMATPFQGLTGDWPVWRKIRHSAMMSRSDWILARQDNYLTGRATLCLQEAIGYRGSFAGTKPIKQLTVHTLYQPSYAELMRDPRSAPLYSIGLEQRWAWLGSNRSYHNMIEAYRSLTDITLVVDHRPYGNDPIHFAVDNETVDLLKASHLLQRLDLSFFDSNAVVEDDQGYNDPHSLPPLFQVSNPWPFLSDLSLSVDASWIVLLPFLELHSSTLKSLRLRDMIVFDATELLRRIPNKLKLTSVYMQCIGHSVLDRGLLEDRYGYAFLDGTDVDECYEQNVKSYLLGNAEQLPALQFHMSDWEEDTPT